MSDAINRMVLKFRDVLAETERLEPDALRAYQNNLLIPLVLHARQNISFYENRLAPLFRGNDVDLTRWNEVPILTRAEAQRRTQALAARVVPPHAGEIESEETSGSTGRPFRHLKNRLFSIAALGITDRMMRWWDLDGDKAMATFISRRRDIAPPPEGATVGTWRIGFNGTHHLLDMWADSDIQVDWLEKRRPNYLTAYSSTLVPLAERARARGVKLKFERIVSVATAMSDEIRNACVEHFGTRPIDQYGAQEAGNLACECPSCGLYHVNAEASFIEILREDGSPCEPGETGRVIVTALYNYAMGFIRYEVGDYATQGPARVKCPIKLPTLSRVIGRYRNTFTLRDGRIIYPYVAIEKFRDYISFEQVQVVQTDYDAIEVRFVPLASRAVDREGLEAYLSKALDSSFHVSVTPVETIPRSASGKFEDFLSLVARNPA